MTVVAIQQPVSVPSKFVVLARDIKVSHTVFALPWAVLATFLAARGWPHPGQLLLILMCMVTARTVAMSANRLLDAELDAINPRTARRAIPSGALSRGLVLLVLVSCAIGFIASTAGFLAIYNNRWPLILSLPVLLFLAAYPLLKRFTRLCHYYLGAALALAPVCAWIAIRGDVALTPLLMAGAVLTWTAGFDIIYACQDYASDVEHGVFSVPSKFGIGAALWISRGTHRPVDRDRVVSDAVVGDVVFCRHRDRHLFADNRAWIGVANRSVESRFGVFHGKRRDQCVARDAGNNRRVAAVMAFHKSVPSGQLLRGGLYCS